MLSRSSRFIETFKKFFFWTRFKAIRTFAIHIPRPGIVWKSRFEHPWRAVTSPRERTTRRSLHRFSFSERARAERSRLPLNGLRRDADVARDDADINSPECIYPCRALIDSKVLGKKLPRVNTLRVTVHVRPLVTRFNAIIRSSAWWGLGGG